MLFLTAAVVTFVSCGDSVMLSGYRVELPAIPLEWREVLGEPRWRLEWRGRAGGTERAVYDSTAAIELDLPPEWPSPVLAWPFWPGVEAGIFRPAGALFPFDAGEGRIRLSWRGGVEAAFYLALEEASAAGSGKNPVRQPRYFDWPRFRAFMAEKAPAELRDDPWLAAWKNAAAKTVSSSFRASYVKAEERAPVKVSIPHNGPWVATSPFRQAEHWNSGDIVELALCAEPEIWVSPGGFLALSKTARMWVLRQGPE